MYSLMLVLSLLATAAFLHVFAFGRRKYLPLFSVLLALMLYTHNWGLFVAAGLGLRARAVLVRLGGPARASAKDALIGFGVRGAALPALAADAAPPGPAHRRALAQLAQLRRADPDHQVAARRRHADGRARAGGGSGLAAVIARRVEDKERTAVIAGAVMVLATLAVAWLVSQVSPAWTTRYLGVLLGPMLLVAALGLSRAGALGLVALVIILGIWAIPRSYGLENKSNASDLRKAVAADLNKGDLVVSMQPEQGPLLAYHLEDLGGAPKLPFREPDRGGRERPRHGLDGRLRQAEGRHSRQGAGTPAC